MCICPPPFSPQTPCPHRATTWWDGNRTHTCVSNCGHLSGCSRQSAIRKSPLARCLYSVTLLTPGCSPLSRKMGVWFSGQRMAGAGLGSPEGHKSPNSSRILLKLVLTNILIWKIYLYAILKCQI